ncbi:SdpI family protein [Shouchella patagoniensis]|uniref:SdpI family protein n=1 Tax=Shouchella patagoniensis TaxID=228576 RepID=UPI0009953C03|nr:SdpI family protein [Shouchella patagoniensis]
MANIAEAVSSFVLGLLVCLLGIPLYYKKVKPNHFYGMTFKGTVSEKEWYAINHYGGKKLIQYGMILFPTGLIPLLTPTFHPVVSLLWAFFCGAMILIPCVQTLLRYYR